MEDLESYEPKSSRVTSVEPGWITVYLEDRIPEFGEAVEVETDSGETVHAVARDRLGARNVRALILGAGEEIEEGASARATGRQGGFRLDDDGSADTRSTEVVPEPAERADDWIPIDWNRPDFDRLAGVHDPVETGYEGVDVVAPIAEGGLNLVVDHSGGPEPFRRLTEAVTAALSPSEIVGAPVHDDGASRRLTLPIRAANTSPQPIVAIRLAVALASHRRDRGDDLAVVVSLPPAAPTPAPDQTRGTEPGYGRIIDLLGEGLASTEEASITTLVRLAIPQDESGLGSIVETLDLGDVDAQISVDESGRFSPSRSTSTAAVSEERRRRAEGALNAIREAERVRDKRELFGELELSPEEREALNRAEKLRTDLTRPASGG